MCRGRREGQGQSKRAHTAHTLNVAAAEVGLTRAGHYGGAGATTRFSVGGRRFVDGNPGVGMTGVGGGMVDHEGVSSRPAARRRYQRGILIGAKR